MFIKVCVNHIIIPFWGHVKLPDRQYMPTANPALVEGNPAASRRLISLRHLPNTGWLNGFMGARTSDSGVNAADVYIPDETHQKNDDGKRDYQG